MSKTLSLLTRNFQPHFEQGLITPTVVISPIQKLPPEILAEIFIVALPSPSERRNPHPSRPPLLFRHICPLWCTVSSATPKLWNTLYLDIAEFIESYSLAQVKALCDGGEAITGLITAWLCRAQSLPLEVTLFIPHSKIHSHNVLRAIIPFANQLRKLRISAPINHLLPLFDIPGGFPLLEALDFDYMEPDGTEFEQPLLSAFKHADHLESLTLGCIEPGIPSISFHRDIATFPWLRLTELYLIDYSPDESVTDILRLASNLTKCSLMLSFFSGPAVTLRSCSHSHMREFKLYGPRRHWIDAILQALTLPALQRLELGGHSNAAILVDLQRRSLFPLQTLYIMPSDVARQGSCIRTLQCVPSVTSFCITFPDYHREEVLWVLSYRPSGEHVIFPRLETFEIKLSETVDLGVHGQALVDMVKTRWHLHPSCTELGFVRLKKVSVVSYGRLRPDVLTQLKDFQREGLVVNLRVGLGLKIM